MSKSKIFIDVIVDDKGTTKKIALTTKQMESALTRATKATSKNDKALQGASKSSKDYERNTKGAAKASSNGTKNFSKMAQGAGGLVAAYATLAASVFAVSAVFNFLKSSADFAVLSQGQEAYAASTGIAMKSLTNDIIAATDAQIGFKDAAQAASIGLASGLSPEQLKKLGKAAKDTSTVLGRDMTDSFNRLVRGVTKAEPELLDELGIILRLETATKSYADALGKNAKDLTAFERSQAVANEVLTQADEKYGKILESQNLLGNSVTKLGVAFQNDLLKPIQEGLTTVVAPVFDFMTNNILALSAALTLLAIPIVKSILPGITNMGEATREASAAAKRGLLEEKALLEDKSRTLKKIAEQQNQAKAQALARAATATAGLPARKGSGLEKLQSGGLPSGPQLKGMERAAMNSAGVYKKLSEGVRTKLIKDFKIIGGAAKATALTITGAGKIMWASWKVGIASVRVAWGSLMSYMAIAAQFMAVAVNRAFSFIAIVGTLFLAIDLIRMGIGLVKEFFETPEETATRKAMEKIKEASDELGASLESVNKELTKMSKQGNDTQGIDRLAGLGNFMSNVSILDLSSALNDDNDEVREKAQATLGIFATEIEKAKGELGPRAKELAKLLTDASLQTFRPDPKWTANMLDQVSAVQTTTDAAKSLRSALTSQKETEKTFLNTLLPKTSFDTMIDSIEITRKSLASLRKLTDEGGGSPLIDADIEKIEKSVKLQTLLIKLRDQEAVAAKAKQKIALKTLKLTEGLTPLVKAQVDKERQVVALRQEIINKEQIIIGKRETLATLKDEENAASKNQIALLEDDIKLQREKADQLERQLDYMTRLGTATEKAAEGAVSKGLSDLIKGNETSIKDTILTIAKTTLEATADTVSDILTEDLFTFLKKQGGPADKMKAVLEKGATLLSDTLKSAADYIKLKIQEGFGTAKSPGITDTSKADENGIVLNELNNKIAVPSISAKAAKDAVGDAEEKQGFFSQLMGKRRIEDSATFGIRPNEKTGLPEEFVDSTFIKGSGLIGLFTDFTRDIGGLFSGEGDFLTGLGGLFKNAGVNFSSIFDAFGEGFGDLLGGLLGGAGGGEGIGGILVGAIGSMFGLPSARYGGVLSPPAGVQSFSGGGIASGSGAGYLANLHGTEAVVPLPNNKSIPVELSGEGGQQNNVVVNVNMDSQGNATSDVQSDGGGGGGIGVLIAKAVQAELQNQKRSGGILSPYGVA